MIPEWLALACSGLVSMIREVHVIFLRWTKSAILITQQDQRERERFVSFTPEESELKSQGLLLPSSFLETNRPRPFSSGATCADSRLTLARLKTIWTLLTLTWPRPELKTRQCLKRSSKNLIPLFCGINLDLDRLLFFRDLMEIKTLQKYALAAAPKMFQFRSRCKQAACFLTAATAFL